MARQSWIFHSAAVYISAYLIFLPTFASGESAVEYCRPYSRIVKTEANVEKPFLQYWLRVKDNGGRKTITVTADQIVLNAENFGSLMRAPSTADSSIERLVFNARKIIVEGPLSLDKGSYSFLARDIEFRDRGVLALLPSANRQITFESQYLHLPGSNFRIFDVRSRRRGDDFSDITNVIDLHAENVYAAGQRVPSESIRAKLARKFTLFPIIDFSSKISVQDGTDAYSYFIDQLKTRGDWLSYSMSVWKSTFMLAPFDEVTACDISAILEEHVNIFEAAAPAQTMFDFRVLENAIKGNSDLQGNGPAWATNRPLSDMLTEIAGYDPNGSSFRRFEFYESLLRASVDGAPVDPTAEVGAISEEIRQKSLEYRNGSNKIDELETSIKAKTEQLKEQKVSYERRMQSLKDHADDLQRGAQDRAAIISALSTAAAIATTAYTGSPQTGAAVGGIIYAVGKSGEGTPTWTALSTGIQFANEIQGPLGNVKDTLGQLKSARSTYAGFIGSFTLQNITIKDQIEVPIKDPPPGSPATQTISRDQALKDLADKAKNLKGGVDGVLKVYNEFSPGQPPVPPAIEEDHSLKELASQMATTLNDIKALVQDIEAQQRVAQDQEAYLVASTEKLSKLTNLPVDDELRRKEFGRLAFDGIRDELFQFVSLIDLVRRISILEFQEALPVDPALIKDAFVMETIGSGFDPTKVFDEQQSGHEYLRLIEQRKIHASLLAGAVVRASDRQFRSYIESRGRTPLVNVPTEEYVLTAATPRVEDRFLKSLNKLIGQQYNARGKPDELGKLYLKRLEIPFDIRRKVDARFPARLLKVAVTGLVLDSEIVSGGDLVFSIDVERVGNLRRSPSIVASLARRNPDVKKECPRRTSQYKSAAPSTQSEDCFSVDLRPKETPEHNLYIPYEYTVGQIKSGNIISGNREQSYWYIKPGDVQPANGRTMMVTYPPAEARMYLRVRLDANTSWKKAPIVEKLAVSAEVFQ